MPRLPRLAFVLVSAAAGLIMGPDAALGQASGRAGITLSDAQATMTQGGHTPWALEKTGTVDATNRTVTWILTATEGVTRHGHLAVHGRITVVNTGAAGATIGNIVVNLQARSGGSWRTLSSDVADATSDDGATRALVVPAASSENAGSFAENAASGSLLFTDATTNSVFALAPQVTIAPGATVTLLFSAGFDNGVLRLHSGQAVRAEAIVTFGNAGPGGPSVARLDIDGSGTIDADEAYVRSVPARLGLTVPAETADDSPVLSDTVTDIAATGTATFSSPLFDLTATSGLVTVSYDPGASGGTITNCAHLRSTSGSIDLQACDSQVIPPPSACTPGTAGCGWKTGDLVTYNQQNWGSINTAASDLLTEQFYSLSPNGVEVGVPGSPGNSALFTTVDAILDYLPASGVEGPFDNDLVDPTSTSAGALGGFVLALQLNVSHSDAGVLGGNSSLRFGDLRVCGLTATPEFNHLTIRQVLVTANQILGGRTTPEDYYATLATLVNLLTESFESGAPSAFAQQHLVNGACPGAWQPGDVIAYSQESWGGDPATNPAAALLLAHFDSAYGGGGVEIGLSLDSGWSVIFTSAFAILKYLPSSGSPGPLTADLVDPTSTSSGLLGGWVLALQLNVDFADAGLLPGLSGAKYGDLRLCNLSSTPAYNGLTLRQFLAVANTALGGGPAAYTYDDIAILTQDVTEAFSNGAVSTFAQQHLVNGACPGAWQPGDVIAYSQESWGGDPATSPAAALLLGHFDSLYGGGVEIGLSVNSGWSVIFTSVSAILNYLPSSGPPGPLTSDLVDPTSTSSGLLGGWVLALQLNVDFADAGLLPGLSGAKYGDLRLCGLSSTPAYNGLTLRQFLAVANTALGGGAAAYSYDDIAALAQDVTEAFSDGAVSAFAQQHLVNGPCAGA